MEKVDCKWKKSTVTISACKDLQALIVTVNFFHHHCFQSPGGGGVNENSFCVFIHPGCVSENEPF